MAWSRRIQGYALMTEHLYQVLGRLIAAEDRGYPWVDLSDVHGITKKTLTRNDWAVASPGLDGTRYKVTGRGRKAYHIYSIPPEPRRYDGICPRCGIRPKARYASGKPYGYCVECDNAAKRRNYRLRGGAWVKNPDRLCPACGERNVEVYASGFVASYCRECKNQRAKAERHRKYARKLARIKAGEHIGCCKCGAPVHYSDKVVYDYCYDCYREYMSAYNRRRQDRRRVE